MLKLTPWTPAKAGATARSRRRWRAGSYDSGRFALQRLAVRKAGHGDQTADRHLIRNLFSLRLARAGAFMRTAGSRSAFAGRPSGCGLLYPERQGEGHRRFGARQGSRRRNSGCERVLRGLWCKRQKRGEFPAFAVCTRAGAAALKQIYRAKDAAAGEEEELNAFAEGPWGRKYPAIAQSWRRHWSEVIPFYAFPDEVRRIIYTTKRNRVIERQIAPSSSRPRPFPHRRERVEASFSWVEPGPKRMKNAAARMGHGESAIRDHIRRQVQVGVTKPAFTRKS